MPKSDYVSYFRHRTPNIPQATFFGVSHLYNRIKVKAGWANYVEIIRHRNGGRILLGQLPVNSFVGDLIRDLSPNGLIVACNESYELTGASTVVKVTSPMSWEKMGIKHHHLPFRDYSEDSQPSLIIETLIKMLEAYQRGTSIYVHCKAGRTRSTLISALFLTVIKLENDPKTRFSDQELESLLLKQIEEIRKKRPETSIDSKKIKMGINVLRKYIDTKLAPEAIDQEAKFFAKLTQSQEFKALWHFAYNNKDYLADMQVIMEQLYQDPKMVLDTLDPDFVQKTPLFKACQKIKSTGKGHVVLTRLKCYLATRQDPNFESRQSQYSEAIQQLNCILAGYQSPLILKIARQIQSDIFLSKAPEDDKIAWLRQTVKFLSNPMQEASSYFKKAEHALLVDDPVVVAIGHNMMYFGAAVLALIFFAAIVGPSIFNLPIVIGVSLTALCLVVLGKCVVNGAWENNVKLHSRQLVRACKEQEEFIPESQPSAL